MRVSSKQAVFRNHRYGMPDRDLLIVSVAQAQFSEPPAGAAALVDKCGCPIHRSVGVDDPAKLMCGLLNLLSSQSQLSNLTADSGSFE